VIHDQIWKPDISIELRRAADALCDYLEQRELTDWECECGGCRSCLIAAVRVATATAEGLAFERDEPAATVTTS